MTRTTHDAFLGDDQLELDLNAVLLTVWARRWILLAVTALFGLMGLALTWGQEPEYWATA